MSESIKFILTKKLNGVIYELMVKTTTHMVYTEDGYTLTELLNDLLLRIAGLEQGRMETNNRLTRIINQIDGMSERLNELEQYWKNQDNALEKLREIVTTTCLTHDDISKELIQKLKDSYSKEEIDTIVDKINEKLSNISDIGTIEDQIIAGDTINAPESLRDGGIYIYIVKE